MNRIRTYSELITLPTFKERFDYLYIGGKVGEETFGFDRWMNQRFYKSKEWLCIKDEIVRRDLGCDLGVVGNECCGRIVIHHMNPLMIKDFVYKTDFLLNPEYLILASLNTHNAIHYGIKDYKLFFYQERERNDTCPWKK